jgi:hypothetical protein
MSCVGDGLEQALIVDDDAGKLTLFCLQRLPFAA